ncbi:hypothetical protein L226DRAFT_46310 [Lentinus tigrinus ALCF2SS1-7]|uniref:uncharacterized protein n=1 Tax=Lentinus tigrinus ALCF2SS1-7 TaxID=1328758 RepID=UPI0011661A0C|nr:hypothetical protein L226DRAFT_46310 [Lentinus tigrinus ALCF2SS1-7]
MKKAQRRRSSNRSASAAKPGHRTAKNLAPRAPSKSATSRTSSRAWVNAPWSPQRLITASESSPACTPSTPSGSRRTANMAAMPSLPLVILPFPIDATTPGGSYAMTPPRSPSATALQWWVPLGPANSPQSTHSGTAPELAPVPAADSSLSAGYTGIGSSYDNWYSGTEDGLAASSAHLQERRSGPTTPSTESVDVTRAADAVPMQRETHINGQAASGACSTLWSPVVEGCWRTVEDAQHAYACIKTRGPATVHRVLHTQDNEIHGHDIASSAYL